MSRFLKLFHICLFCYFYAASYMQNDGFIQSVAAKMIEYAELVIQPYYVIIAATISGDIKLSVHSVYCDLLYCIFTCGI